MPLNSKLGLFGLAKQTTAGTLATPVYGHGLTSGGLSISRTPSALKTSSGVRTSRVGQITTQSPSANPVAPAYVSSLGAYLLAALGVDTVTGSTAPYIHTFSPGSLPWYSLYGMLGGSEYLSLVDAKCGTLKLSWTGSEALSLDATWSARGINPAQATWSATTSLDGSSSFFVPIGGTFMMDASTATPVNATVISGDLTLTNTLDTQYASGSTLPAVIQEGDLEGACTLTMIPDNLREWQAAVSGSPSGTTASNNPVYGSLSLEFMEANGGPGTLTVTSGKIMWEAPYPGMDSSGAAVQLAFTGLPLSAGATVAPLVFALSNSVATY